MKNVLGVAFGAGRVHRKFSLAGTRVLRKSRGSQDVFEVRVKSLLPSAIVRIAKGAHINIFICIRPIYSEIEFIYVVFTFMRRFLQHNSSHLFFVHRLKAFCYSIDDEKKVIPLKGFT